MYNGTGEVSVLFVYPMKYFNEPFLPYQSFLDNTITLVSTLSILIVLLFLRNAFLLIHCLSKSEAFYFIFIPCKEKKYKNFLCWFFSSQ